MKKLLGVLLVLVVLLVGFFTVVPKEDRDHINPFVLKEDVYVQINEEAVPKDGRYEYALNGYNEKGEEKEVTFDSGKVLKEDAYLKITVKGDFVEGWEEVQGEDIPESVKAKLN
ncbi:YxeA family protein [Fictibacillus phosphorivorans]|uniref:YxeA family protein n=1 Tax=Fictibacillus phosphorivorans TaxID=1221500 RepID=UPI00203D55A8|nr:YxeA family protein [Fictibacillus phosphorivorans]MCM3716774.1 YxeA family protein [Fictibacillus phosphorivorans]MCM3774677.1 YxeA family protein [Fictibacillus phosphorivorans]